MDKISGVFFSGLGTVGTSEGVFGTWGPVRNQKNPINTLSIHSRGMSNVDHFFNCRRAYPLQPVSSQGKANRNAVPCPRFKREDQMQVPWGGVFRAKDA